MLALLSVMMSSFAEAKPIEGRMLHAGLESESRSNYYTETFADAPNTYGTNEEFEDAYLWGTIIGFIVTGIAMIFAVTVIIYDEIKRHEKFTKDVIDSERVLRSKWQCTASDIEGFKAELAQRELARTNKKLADEQERARLAEVN